MQCPTGFHHRNWRPRLRLRFESGSGASGEMGRGARESKRNTRPEEIRAPEERIRMKKGRTKRRRTAPAQPRPRERTKGSLV